MDRIVGTDLGSVSRNRSAELVEGGPVCDVVGGDHSCQVGRDHVVAVTARSFHGAEIDSGGDCRGDRKTAAGVMELLVERGRGLRTHQVADHDVRSRGGCSFRDLGDGVPEVGFSKGGDGAAANLDIPGGGSATDFLRPDTW